MSKMTTTTIIWKHQDGRQVIERVDQSGEITYDANFNLDKVMYDYGDEDQDEGYMMIQEWLEDEEFEEANA